MNESVKPTGQQLKNWTHLARKCGKTQARMFHSPTCAAPRTVMESRFVSDNSMLFHAEFYTVIAGETAFEALKERYGVLHGSRFQLSAELFDELTLAIKEAADRNRRSALNHSIDSEQ